MFLVLLVEAGWPPSYEGGYGESRIDGRGDGVFLVLGSWFLVLGGCVRGRWGDGEMGGAARHQLRMWGDVGGRVQAPFLTGSGVYCLLGSECLQNSCGLVPQKLLKRLASLCATHCAAHYVKDQITVKPSPQEDGLRLDPDAEDRP